MRGRHDSLPALYPRSPCAPRSIRAHLAATVTTHKPRPRASPGKGLVRLITLTNPGLKPAPLPGLQSFTERRAKKVSNR